MPSATNAHLRRNLDYYIKHQDDLVRRYNGRTLLIHDCHVVAAFDSPADAYYEGLQRFTPGSFTVQRCSPGVDDYTVNHRTAYRFSEAVLP